MKLWPQPISSAFSAASFLNSGSVPSCRTRQGPELSQNPTPNFASGTDAATASNRSSMVLMKCAWPSIMLQFSGGSILTVLNSKVMLSLTDFVNVGVLRLASVLLSCELDG